MLQTLFLLLGAHALCDYPLQGDFLARGKNHRNPISGVPWYQCLLAHAMIHAMAVLLITHSVGLACAELVIHTITDWAKCEGWFGFDTDQMIHVICKLIWWAILLM